MSNKNTEPTTRPKERAFIVGVEFNKQDSLLTTDVEIKIPFKSAVALGDAFAQFI